MENSNLIVTTGPISSALNSKRLVVGGPLQAKPIRIFAFSILPLDYSKIAPYALLSGGTINIRTSYYLYNPDFSLVHPILTSIKDCMKRQIFGQVSIGVGYC